MDADDDYKVDWCLDVLDQSRGTLLVVRLVFVVPAYELLGLCRHLPVDNKWRKKMDRERKEQRTRFFYCQNCIQVHSDGNFVVY